MASLLGTCAAPYIRGGCPRALCESILGGLTLRAHARRGPLRIECGVGQNRLLTGLSARSRNNVLQSCESKELPFADVIYQPGDRMGHVYFPTEGFVSVVAVLDDGGELEVGLVGSEGMIGASLVLGVDVCADLAIVQREGTALRMTAGDFRRHCEQDKVLRGEIQRYLYVCVTQLAQVAACTGYHLVQARLARWLLMSRDRARSNEFHLTQEFLAYMLGVRRVGVTQAAAALQAKGLIRYSRGEITILNSAGLKEASCACYGRGNRIYAATMNQDVKRPRALRSRKNSVQSARI